MDYILKMDIEDFFDLVEAAKEKSLEEKIWQRWLLDSLGMNEDNFIDFEAYKKLLTTKSNIKEVNPIEDAQKILKIKR